MSGSTPIPLATQEAHDADRSLRFIGYIVVFKDNATIEQVQEYAARINSNGVSLALYETKSYDIHNTQEAK